MHTHLIGAAARGRWRCPGGSRGRGNSIGFRVTAGARPAEGSGVVFGGRSGERGGVRGAARVRQQSIGRYGVQVRKLLARRHPGRCAAEHGHRPRRRHRQPHLRGVDDGFQRQPKDKVKLTDKNPYGVEVSPYVASGKTTQVLIEYGRLKPGITPTLSTPTPTTAACTRPTGRRGRTSVSSPTCPSPRRRRPRRSTRSRRRSSSSRAPTRARHCRPCARTARPLSPRSEAHVRSA